MFCTQTFVNNPEMYVKVSYCMPGCTTPTNLNQPLSWEVSTSPAELAGNNTGRVGPKYCTGVQDRLPVQPTSEVHSTPLSILCQTAPTDHGGDHRAATERGYRGGKHTSGGSVSIDRTVLVPFFVKMC